VKHVRLKELTFFWMVCHSASSSTELGFCDWKHADLKFKYGYEILFPIKYPFSGARQIETILYKHVY
jgi:hypothetical protein